MTSASERIEAKLDHLSEQGEWIVKALKYLLAEGIDVALDNEDDWLDEDQSAFEHTAVRTRPQPKPPACRHRQQAIIGGVLQCAECHYVFNGTGVKGRDATSPVPDPGNEHQFNHGTRV